MTTRGQSPEIMVSETAESVSAMRAPTRHRDNPLTRSWPGMIGLAVLITMLVACLGTLPWTLSSASGPDGQSLGVPRYDAGAPIEGRLPPSLWPMDARDIARANAAVDRAELALVASQHNVTADELLEAREGELLELIKPLWPRYALGSDLLGRSLLTRLLAGGGISLTIGIAAALLSVSIGTIYGALAAYVGGKIDSVMMRVVDVLYGLPYILLVVLLAVAINAMVDEWVTRSKAKEDWMRTRVVELQSQDGRSISRSDATELLARDPAFREELLGEASARFPAREISVGTRTALDVLTLLVAIGGVSWLTMARVIRGQVLSLKNQPFVEAARAVGSSPVRIFVRHLLPNLLGPIIVYATLTVPQAILQESFLSFLGIGVKPPLPSWGNLAAEGLGELNTYRSHWWLLFFPCLLLGVTLLSMNFVGEGLREAFDPKRSR
jgi:oligopeptide transport system permease protein